MCLAIPARLIKCEGDSAVVDLHGNQVEICTALTPGVQVGGWVLVHAGFAIQSITDEEAKETFAILKDIEKAGREGGCCET
jgi:hydrogenase expression/formation protein HypC